MERSTKLVLAATGVSFVSQFFEYKVDTRGGYLSMATNTDYYTGLTLTGAAGGTGWELHPQAYILLTVLAIVYGTGTHESGFWSRRGHWIAAAAIFFATIPADAVSTPGGAMGGAAIVLAVWSVLVRRKEIARRPE